MAYNPRYFDTTTSDLHTYRGHISSVWKHICADGTIIGMFQGNRGLYPAIDFQIKVLNDGVTEKLYTPAHYDWVTDLLIKSHFFPQEIAAILDYYINFYTNICIPFASQAQRNTHQLQTVQQISTRFAHVVVPRTMSIEALATLIELFCYCEKRNQPVAHQFNDALQLMRDYSNNLTDIKTVMHLVCSHF